MGTGKAVKKSPAAAWQELRIVDLIRGLGGRLPEGELGIGDDASAHEPEAGLLEIVTCDAMVEGVHWDAAWCGPKELGKKLAAVNLSDIAAMGGSPRRAHLVLALPGAASASWVREVVGSLVLTLRQYGARLVGGDTVFSPGPAMLALTLQGVADKHQLVRRSGAKPGDVILVTGDLGGAAAGLGLAQQGQARAAWAKPLLQRLLSPKARVAAGRVLAQSGLVHAMLDVSDGLGSDLRRLAQAGKVGARIFAAQLPIAAATRQAARHLQLSELELALSGGEDYELLFAAASGQAQELISLLRQKADLACTVVGEILPLRAGLTLVKPDGKAGLLPVGWEHGGRSRV